MHGAIVYYSNTTMLLRR